MEEGSWDLSKVDKEALKDSKLAFVFGQMNEPPGARARVALSGVTLAEHFRDGDQENGGQGRDILSSWTTYSVSRRQDPKFLRFWDVCHRQWVTSLRSLRKWVLWKSV